MCKVASSELPCLFCVPDAVLVPTYANEAPQYDISSEGEDQPSDNSNDGEWWPDEVDLNAVTIGNMSLDGNPVATDGERGRYREITVDSGAGESVVNPDDWPNVDLKPSKGSVKGQRYVGPGGEKMDNLGELTVKVRTERYGGGDISSRVTFQGPRSASFCLQCQE